MKNNIYIVYSNHWNKNHISLN